MSNSCIYYVSPYKSILGKLLYCLPIVLGDGLVLGVASPFLTFRLPLYIIYPHSHRNHGGCGFHVGRAEVNDLGMKFDELF